MGSLIVGSCVEDNDTVDIGTGNGALGMSISATSVWH